MNPKMTTLKLIAAAASLAILSGCASTSALEEVRRTAEAAQAEAAAARSIATQAQGTANQALTTANEAKADSEAARRTADQNRDEMNRMFQRSMQK